MYKIIQVQQASATAFSVVSKNHLELVGGTFIPDGPVYRVWVDTSMLNTDSVAISPYYGGDELATPPVPPTVDTVLISDIKTGILAGTIDVTGSIPDITAWANS